MVFDFIFYFQISPSFQTANLSLALQRPQKAPLKLNAEAALSLRIKQNGAKSPLFKKNIQESLPIASLTKIMTAAVVLEDLRYDIENGSVFVSPEAAAQGDVPHLGNLNSEVGKKIPIKRLLELMLSYSSNDAAFALSEVVRTEDFIEKMNERAKTLGMTNTRFINPHGLDFQGEYSNYSTAQDMAKLTEEAIKNHSPIFELSLKSAPESVENGISELILKPNQEMLGGKTGFTKEARGSILIVFKDKSGNIFINIILGAESEEARIEEMQKLINWL